MPRVVWVANSLCLALRVRTLAALLLITTVAATACRTNDAPTAGPSATAASGSVREPEPTAVVSISPMPAGDAWGAYADFGEGDRSSLSATMQKVFAICDLRQEVNSGGFDSYFRYWGGDTASVALAALPDVLGDAWARLLREAMQTLGPNYPADADARAGLLDDRDLDEVLNEFDSRFYELEASTDADGLVNAYLVAGS